MTQKTAIAVLYTLDYFPPVSFNPGDDLVRDGQRYLLERLLGRDNVAWTALWRYLPGTWCDHRLRGFSRIHPKRLWPYWPLFGRQARQPFRRIDHIINASGPLLYGGRRFHSAYEPWALALRQILTGDGAPGFLNLAFGTNFGYDSAISETSLFQRLNRKFSREICGPALVNTTRDPLAQEILAAAGVPSQPLPCPSLLARKYHAADPTPGSHVLVNFHPSGTRTRAEYVGPDQAWIAEFRAFLDLMKRDGLPFRFIFHETAELDAARTHLGDLVEDYVMPDSVAAFLDAYGSARAAFTCRVHGGYAAASFGVPSVVAGYDSRMRMMELLGLPTVRVVGADHERMFEALRQLLRERDTHRDRLLQICGETEDSYLALLSTCVSPR